jgi:hypothetical protein
MPAPPCVCANEKTPQIRLDLRRRCFGASLPGSYAATIFFDVDVSVSGTGPHT